MSRPDDRSVILDAAAERHPLPWRVWESIGGKIKVVDANQPDGAPLNDRNVVVGSIPRRGGTSRGGGGFGLVVAQAICDAMLKAREGGAS